MPIFIRIIESRAEFKLEANVNVLEMKCEASNLTRFCSQPTFRLARKLRCESLNSKYVLGERIFGRTDDVTVLIVVRDAVFQLAHKIEMKFVETSF